MTRETYYGALFALLQNLQTSGAVIVCDRRVRLLEDLGDAELPALFMTVDNQQTVQQRGLPAKHELNAKVFLYTSNPDEHVSAGIALNTLIDAVEAVLAPDAATNVLTLGGLVHHAWITGTTEVFEGPASDKAAAILTINMLVP